MLALAGALARQQRRGDRLRGGNRGQFVRQYGPKQPWARLVGARLHRRQSGKTLDHRIVGGLFGIWTHLAKAADRDINDLRRDIANGLLADAEPVGDAGANILHKNVGAGGEPQQGPSSSFRLEIEDDRAFVAVVVEE